LLPYWIRLDYWFTRYLPPPPPPHKHIWITTGVITYLAIQMN